jgi:hypothetical protein
MRPLKKEEYDFILAFLKDTPDTSRLIDTLPDLMVEEMDDGGMGSLKLLCGNNNKRRMGKDIARIDLFDVDGIPLSITLNLDEQENLYELDIWKVDFSPLRRFPQYPKVKL